MMKLLASVSVGDYERQYRLINSHGCLRGYSHGHGRRARINDTCANIISFSHNAGRLLAAHRPHYIKEFVNERNELNR